MYKKLEFLKKTKISKITLLEIFQKTTFYFQFVMDIPNKFKKPVAKPLREEFIIPFFISTG